MRLLVQNGYNRGHYEKVFHANEEPNSFELQFLDSLCSSIPPKARILDLGVGTGIPYDKYLASRWHQVIGVDFSSRLIIQAIKNVPQAEYILSDLSNTWFAEKSFDAMVCLYAVFHIPRDEHRHLLANIYAWLKPKGIILITVGVYDLEYSKEENWCGVKMAWNSYDAHTYIQIMNKLGFNITNSRFEGQPGDKEYHFWIMAQKQ